MLVKDIIALACLFTENEEIISAFEENNCDDEEFIVIECLEKCFNLVREEIASEYLPMTKTQNFITQDFKVCLNDFSEKVVSVLSVKDKNGNKVKFKLFDEYLMAMAHEINVVYSFKPEHLVVTDEFSSLLPERVYAYGIAKEYYFLQGMFDESEVWKERFAGSLKILTKNKKSATIPRRRWI